MNDVTFSGGRDLFVLNIAQSTLISSAPLMPLLASNHSCNFEMVSRLCRYCLSWQASPLCARIGTATPLIQLHTQVALIWISIRFCLHHRVGTPVYISSVERIRQSSRERLPSRNWMKDGSKSERNGDGSKPGTRMKRTRDSKGWERIKCRDRNVTGVAASAFVTVVYAVVRLCVAVCGTSGVADWVRFSNIGDS